MFYPVRNIIMAICFSTRIENQRIFTFVKNNPSYGTIIRVARVNQNLLQNITPYEYSIQSI